jgi:hypothetical protein
MAGLKQLGAAICVVAMASACAASESSPATSDAGPGHNTAATGRQYEGRYVETDASNSSIRLTLIGVSTPSAPQKSRKLVSVKFRLSGLAGSFALSSSLVELLGSGGPTFPANGHAGRCKSLNFYTTTVRAGERLTRCVVFRVPRRYVATAVRWGPQGGQPGKVINWRVHN